MKPHIVFIVYTHCNNVDHTDNVQFLEEKTGAAVFIGREDLSALLNKTQRSGIKSLIQKIIRVIPQEQVKTYEDTRDSGNI